MAYNRPQVFVVDSDDGAKTQVSVTPVGAGAFVAVGPLVTNPMMPVLRPLVFVADVRRDLAALLPD